MAGDIYKKPVLFAIVSAVVILIGTAVTMFIPMLTEEMHPKLENLKPYTALQLAGKDIYQREGCNGCHTQTVRPLKAEVLRYGEYSKAGEFAYDRPFLWGSKRTGPDLARIGGKYPDKWHDLHFENAQSIYPESNMPAYGWLRKRQLDPSAAEAHMRANGFPFTSAEIAGLKDKNELDALIAYMQVIGTAVTKSGAGIAEASPLPESATQDAVVDEKELKKTGASLYKQNCAFCHGETGEGNVGPSLVDRSFFAKPGDGSDEQYRAVIAKGTDAGMPAYGSTLDKNKIRALVLYIRSLQQKR